MYYFRVFTFVRRPVGIMGWGYWVISFPFQFIYSKFLSLLRFACKFSLHFHSIYSCVSANESCQILVLQCCSHLYMYLKWFNYECLRVSCQTPKYFDCNLGFPSLQETIFVSDRLLRPDPRTSEYIHLIPSLSVFL